MNERTHREYEQRNVLKNAGWDVPKRDFVAFNSGSETLRHFVCKAIVGKCLKDNDYRVGSEIVGHGLATDHHETYREAVDS